jgi:hypothetical protein
MTSSNAQDDTKIRLQRGTKHSRRPNGVYLAKARSRITNGKQLLPGVDQRSLYVRRFRDIHTLHVSDLGGPDNVSQAELSLIRRIACITVEAERIELLFAQNNGASDSKLEIYRRLAETLKRLLESIGLKRVPKDVTTLEQYLSNNTPAPREARVSEVFAGGLLPDVRK